MMCGLAYACTEKRAYHKKNKLRESDLKNWKKITIRPMSCIKRRNSVNFELMLTLMLRLMENYHDAI